MDDRRTGMVAERRHEERLAIVGGEVTLSLDGQVKEIPVITYDMSQSGMAILLSSRLVSGTPVSLRGEGVGNVIRMATVKWCRRVEAGIYKAGLSFS